VHEVEVRGDKTKAGIRFKCADIQKLFEMETLNTHIHRMIDQTEYDIFCSDKLANWARPSEHNIGGQPTSMYLTYNGLLKM